MPLISTGTMGSNKSFGFSRGKPKVLTTYTFPAGSSTWTAPAGVTSLTSAVGKGSNGTPQGWVTSNSRSRVAGALCSSVPVYGASLTYDEVYNEALNLASFFNNNISLSGTTINMTSSVFFYWCSTNSNWRRFTSTLGTLTWRRVGTCSVSTTAPTTGTVPTTGNIFANYSILNLQFSDGPYAGTATTGFSLTFPGGSTSVTTATDTTFNNVTVSPGTTYTITNNGSLTITYFV